MRTNVVIEDDVITEAMRLTGIKTKRGVIDAALRTLVRLQRQRAVLALEGRIAWAGDLNALRKARLVADGEEGYDARTG
jgi:Arc/MetJ family transcription regulator